MNAWARNKGFTIVEMLIVLAVTGSLIIVAFSFMSGRSRRLAFENDIIAFQTKLDDVINNVSSGYYSRIADFTCTANSGVISISTVPSGRGTNPDCQFLGRAIHVNQNWDEYGVHNVVGLRRVSTSGPLVKSITEAKPRLLSLGTTYNTGVETVEITKMYNAKIGATKYSTNTTPGTTNRGFLAFISSFPDFSTGSSNPEPGAQSVNLYVFDNTGTITDLSQSKNTIVDIFTVANIQNYFKTISEFQFCFDSQVSSQRGIVVVGQDGNDLKTSQRIESGDCSGW